MAVQIIDGDTVLDVDLVLETPIEFPGAVTQYPIETGGNVADHIRLDSIRITVRCFVTNTPLSGPAPTAVADAYAALKAIRDAKRGVAVIVDLERFTSMGLESLSIPRSAADGYLPRALGSAQAPAGGFMTFTAEFVQMRIVDTQLVQVPARRLRAGKTRSQGSRRHRGGRQATTTVTDRPTVDGYNRALTNIGNDVQDVLRPGQRGLPTYTPGRGPIAGPSILTPPG